MTWPFSRAADQPTLLDGGPLPPGGVVSPDAQRWEIIRADLIAGLVAVQFARFIRTRLTEGDILREVWG